MSRGGDYTLHQYIAAHEGFQGELYQCPAGKNTIGFGFNLDALAMPKLVALVWLDMLVSECIRDLTRIFPNFDWFGEARQWALVDMRYNLGVEGFRGFEKMRKAIEERDWAKAADEALDSKWSKDVGSRAEIDAELLRRGMFPES